MGDMGIGGALLALHCLVRVRDGLSMLLGRERCCGIAIITRLFHLRNVRLITAQCNQWTLRIAA